LSEPVLQQKFGVLSSTLQILWANQEKLAESETRLDEQFAVLARACIRSINEILVRIGSDDLITYESVNELFMEWEKFRSRPDFRDHMRTWFMGEDLSTLPPPPPVETKEEEKAPDALVKDEDAEEFGGDYAEASDAGNETTQEVGSEDAGASPEDAVPARQASDETTHDASGEADAAVP
jgi:hypothetical protein